ncbi:hypothetical protein HPB51_020209 [Rhipicephalus microplus]|uniref:Uncharacterized protein n=1 Tax=Rhipicephalus microplus TaxID=6941 RepID=A0A9J6EC99_RHIMP|nr:hypothetical protein HPB51_020209 [Rhipicephalus microplus]
MRGSATVRMSAPNQVPQSSRLVAQPTLLLFIHARLSVFCAAKPTRQVTKPVLNSTRHLAFSFIVAKKKLSANNNGTSKRQHPRKMLIRNARRSSLATFIPAV